MLTTLWDEKVTQCLYFAFDSHRHKNMDSYIEVPKAVDRVATQCDNLCGKIPRLAFKFDFKARLDYDMTLGEGGCVNSLLLDHCHFKTVIIIGLTFTEYELSQDLFADMMRRP